MDSPELLYHVWSFLDAVAMRDDEKMKSHLAFLKFEASYHPLPYERFIDELQDRVKEADRQKHEAEHGAS